MKRTKKLPLTWLKPLSLDGFSEKSSNNMQEQVPINTNATKGESILENLDLPPPPFFFINNY